MSYSNPIAVDAGADLSAAQYHAIAVGGTIAATNTATMGLLLNKPENAEDASLGYSGRLRFRAGAAVTAGNGVRVTTSGWLIAATSGYPMCGKSIDTVSSGGIGEGIFDFATAKFSETDSA